MCSAPPPSGAAIRNARPAVRDGDAAGQPGRGLFFAGHRRGDQPFGIDRASGVGEAADQAPDHGLLVGTRVHVEQNQIGVDDGSGGGAGHGGTFAG
jgi:hypothetical protein